MGAKEEAFRNLSKASIGIIMLFPLLGIMRANEVDFEKVSSLDGFVKTVIFGLPRYLSDTLVSISVHADFAARSGVPTGYFTFDSFYRLFSSVLDVSLKDANEIFGHVYYRHLDAPYGWTQTNLIPRLIADFGDNFWLALMGIAALVQWISVCFFRVSFIGVCIRALMIIASAYSVLGAMWFSAFNMLILFYCVLLYWALSARVPTTAKQFM